MLEGFRPGVWERLGVELCRDAILCSITGYGEHGPRARDAGHDLNYLGYAGVLPTRHPRCRRCRSPTSPRAHRAQ